MISEAFAAMKIETKKEAETFREEEIRKATTDSETELTESQTTINTIKIEEILGYNFTNPNLLVEAFTHASFAPGNCYSYDRLEYVGDAVLNLLFSKEHYFSYPELSSGQLTRLRASNVDTEKLARVALTHGLHRFLRHNKPLYNDQVSHIIHYFN